jgi:TldD protein
MFPITLAALAWAAPDLEDWMTEELDRATRLVESQPDHPHYVALQIVDADAWTITAQAGTIEKSTHEASRYLDVDLRVGNSERDSTHELRGDAAYRWDDRRTVQLPLGDPKRVEYGIRHAIAAELNRSYRYAAETMVVLRANTAVSVEEDDTAADFEPRSSVVANEPVPPLVIDVPGWERTLTAVSRRLETDPRIHKASVEFTATHDTRRFVDTEGSRLVHGRNGLRVMFTLDSIADDGDQVTVYDAIDVDSVAELPTADALLARADAVAARLIALRNAPRAKPYSGPVLLGGRAAAVLVHEVLGHRVEGHRQKSENEGKTFADYVDKPILPEFLSIYDDPTLATLRGLDLNGHYRFDDEGVPAQRADLIRDGVFRGFLMSRSPIARFPQSNGHGRREVGSKPVARMANTVHETSAPVPIAKLRQQLVDEAKRQGLPFAIYVEEIDGGLTLTGRNWPNSFNVRAAA